MTDKWDSVIYIWTPSLIEKILEWKNGLTREQTKKLLLKSLTLEKAAKYPTLYAKPDSPPAFANQKVMQHWAKDTDYHGMLWEMGTGKTRGAVEGYMIKRKQGKVRKCLVVCPKSMVLKWAVEFELWGENIDSLPLLGGVKERLEICRKHEWEVIVTNFESVEKMMEFFEGTKNEEGFVDSECLVILDEFTKIKNPRAKRSKAAIRLGRLTEHKLILSGTPITQHAYDAFAPYLFLDKGRTFGLNYDQFIDQHYWREGYRLSAKHGALEKISDKLYENSTRFLKKDCIDIPDKVYDTRILQLPPYNRERYDEMLEWAITQIEGSEKVVASVILVQLLRLSQITSGFIKDVEHKEVPFEENPKIDALRDIFETSNSQKIIVWSRFVHDVQAITELCDEMNIGYVRMTGSEGDYERHNAIIKFQNDPECKVFVGTASTGGHGIDLTAASIVVYYSNSYSLEQRLQSEDRAHRAGQRNQVTYIDLICDKTIDMSIYKILRSKKNVADIVTKDNVRSMLR
jgi:SNF2 family DNA or RNA helicase